MAQTAYWVASSTAAWPPGTPTAAQIKAGQLANGASAIWQGNETGFSTAAGTRNITEATATTGMTASTSYTMAWVVEDTVLGFSNVVEGTATTSAAAGLPVNGTSTGTFTMTGSATATVNRTVSGASTGTFTMSGSATATVGAALLAANGISDVVWQMTGVGSSVSVGAGLPVNGGSTGTFTMTGSATATVNRTVTGTSTGTFTMTGSATASVGAGLPVNGTSSRSFTMTGTATGTIAAAALPVNGGSTGTFTMTGTATATIKKLGGQWKIIYSVEIVPFPGTTSPVFSRITWNGYDPADTWVAGSQAYDDCYAQTLSNFQSRAQPQGFFDYIVIGP